MPTELQRMKSWLLANGLYRDTEAPSPAARPLVGGVAPGPLARPVFGATVSPAAGPLGAGRGALPPLGTPPFGALGHRPPERPIFGQLGVMPELPPEGPEPVRLGGVPGTVGRFSRPQLDDPRRMSPSDLGAPGRIGTFNLGATAATPGRGRPGFDPLDFPPRGTPPSAHSFGVLDRSPAERPIFGQLGVMPELRSQRPAPVPPGPQLGSLRVAGRPSPGDPRRMLPSNPAGLVQPVSYRTGARLPGPSSPGAFPPAASERGPAPEMRPPAERIAQSGQSEINAFRAGAGLPLGGTPAERAVRGGAVQPAPSLTKPRVRLENSPHPGRIQVERPPPPNSLPNLPSSVEERAALVYRRLHDVHKWPDEWTAAAMGSFHQESFGFIPTTVNPDNGAFGLPQYTGIRRKRFEEWAKANGRSPTDLYAQVDYFVHEMTTDPYERQIAFRKMQEARTLDDAMGAMGHYERYDGYKGGRAGGGDTGRRYEYADEYHRNIKAGKYNQSSRGGKPGTR